MAKASRVLELGPDEFDLPEEDSYSAVVTKAEIGLTRTTENERLSIVLEIQKNGTTFKVFDGFTLVPQSFRFLRRFLNCVGVTSGNASVKVDIDKAVKKLPGMAVGIVVKHEEYQGRTRAKVAEYYPLKDEDDLEEGEEM